MTKFILLALVVGLSQSAFASRPNCGDYIDFAHSVDRWEFSSYMDSRSHRGEKSDVKFVKGIRSALKDARWSLRSAKKLAMTPQDLVNWNALDSRRLFARQSI